MSHIDYFRLQAKNLFKDYKNRTSPRYFNIDEILINYEDILIDCGWQAENLSLMNIQHLLASMLGFKKWADLLNASPPALELAKLRFDNQDKIPLEEWDDRIANLAYEENVLFDDESVLEYFKHFLSHYEGYGSPYSNYRLNQNIKLIVKSKKPHISKAVSDVQITSLPLSKLDRVEFINTANSVFEMVVERIEPNNPELTRKLWDAGDYVDNYLLSEDMLPISKDYALSLIDAFLVNHVIGLATEAD